MNIEKMKNNCDKVANLLKILGHSKRLLILCHLLEGEKNVGELEELCETSQSQMSQFLKKLETEDVIQRRREGKKIYYDLKGAEIIELMETLHTLYACK